MRLQRIEQHDKDAGGSDLFKGQHVRAVVECYNCNKPRCIYGKYSFTGSVLKLSMEERVKRETELEQFQEAGFMCGEACPVEGMETKRSIRCGAFVETQYYTFAKKTTTKESAEICCNCCNDKDLVTKEQVAESVKLDGGTPLPICKHCLDQKITPPTVNASTNFFEKAKQAASAKKRQLDTAVSKGYRKGRKSKKA